MLFVVISYIILLLVPLMMGIISGMGQHIEIRKELGLSVINAVIMCVVVFIGYLLSLLLMKTLDNTLYLSGIIIIISGIIMLLKGGKSNIFIMAADTKHYRRYFMANVAVGMNIVIASLGLYLFCVFKSTDSLLFGALSFIMHYIGIKLGYHVHKIRFIKIFILICGIMLILFGLIAFTVDYNKELYIR